MRSCRPERPRASLNRGTTIESIGADEEVLDLAPDLVGLTAILTCHSRLPAIYTAPGGCCRARPTGAGFAVLSGRGDDSGAPPKSVRSSCGGLAGACHRAQGR